MVCIILHLSEIAIGQHENCNLGYSPAHAVVTRKGAEQIDTYVQVLVKLNATFGIDQKNSSGFQLFNSTKYGGENLLFKDSAVALQEITKKTVKDYFGDYYTDYKAINCKEPKPTGTSQPTSKATALAVQLIIVPLSMLVTLLAGRMWRVEHLSLLLVCKFEKNCLSLGACMCCSIY